MQAALEMQAQVHEPAAMLGIQPLNALQQADGFTAAPQHPKQLCCQGNNRLKAIG